MTTEAYKGYAVVELMGHHRLVGRVEEIQQYGVTMMRLDVIDATGAVIATQFCNGSALYRVTPCDEASAIASARISSDAAPVKSWELPRQPMLTAPRDVDDDDPDDDENDPDSERNEPY